MKRTRPEKDKEEHSIYEKVENIGKGAYGEVYRGINKKTNERVAMKEIKAPFTSGGVAPSMLREIAALKRLNHDYIVKYIYKISKNRLIDTIFIGRNINLVLEYIPYDLSTYFLKKAKQNVIITLSDRKLLAYRIFTAVEFIHANSILHRDLKPRNILITEEGIPKVADFGLARSYQISLGNYTHEIQSLFYRAPEILLGTVQYSTGVDVWSLGCILYEIFSNKIMFPGDSEIGQLYSIFQILGTPNEECWPGVVELRDYQSKAFPRWEKKNMKELYTDFPTDGIDLLEKILCYDPLKRISLKEALVHPFFKEIR